MSARRLVFRSQGLLNPDTESQPGDKLIRDESKSGTVPRPMETKLANLASPAISTVSRNCSSQLMVPAKERDENGKPRVSGGKGSSCGTPQGGVTQRVGEKLVHHNVAPWTEVRDRLNSISRGWSTYFGYGTRLMAYGAVD
jgi:hypothetical protein